MTPLTRDMAGNYSHDAPARHIGMLWVRDTAGDLVNLAGASTIRMEAVSDSPHPDPNTPASIVADFAGVPLVCLFASTVAECAMFLARLHHWMISNNVGVSPEYLDQKFHVS